jgi:hypothetical protein
MISREKLEALILACMVLISRFACRSHDLYDLDSVNFALAMERFDPRVHQPHPPGYFLYVCLGRLCNSMLHDANLALVVLSIAASCGVILIIYKMALDWFGVRAARFASALFLFSPLAWFHGTVALTYSVEAFFSALLGYLCWCIDSGNAALIGPAGIILGISAGVRPSSLLFLGPLYLFSLRSASLSRKLAGLAALILTLVSWLVPMISASGGIKAYFGALVSLWRAVPSTNTLFNSSPATSIARACTIAFIYLLGFGAASLALVHGLRHTVPADPRKKLFTVVWIAPALCFFTFIFLLFVNSGYLLLMAAPACIWLGSWASEWYASSAWRRTFKLAVIGVCAAVNVLIFLASPFYCSYRSVRRFEAQLEGIRTALPQLGGADKILIIGFDSHFLGYRHAGYYLPNYLTVEYPEVKLGEGTRLFALCKHNTRLSAELPVASYSRFVFFPLPSGDASYEKYLDRVKGMFPGKSLRTSRIGGYDFVSGPIQLLPILFPNAATAKKAKCISPASVHGDECKQPCTPPR